MKTFWQLAAIGISAALLAGCGGGSGESSGGRESAKGYNFSCHGTDGVYTSPLGAANCHSSNGCNFIFVVRDDPNCGTKP